MVLGFKTTTVTTLQQSGDCLEGRGSSKVSLEGVAISGTWSRLMVGDPLERQKLRYMLREKGGSSDVSYHGKKKSKEGILTVEFSGQLNASFLQPKQHMSKSVYPTLQSLFRSSYHMEKSLSNVSASTLHPVDSSINRALRLKAYGLFCSFHSSCHTAESADVPQNHGRGEGCLKEYSCIEVTLVEEGIVGLIVLNRPEVLNALSEPLMHEVVDALQDLDALQEVGAIVITGKGKAFAAGADIKEMKDKALVDIYTSAFPSKWNEVARIQKPIIAAVNGYALGGGCEMALMCDIILAGDKALFGQPEINLGTIPGMGGTQRLIREVGKSRAMEMILSGKYFIDAQEACQRGLASRVIAGGNEKLVDEAIALAKRISQQSRPAILMAKAAINSAYEIGLQEGVRKEQAIFGATFGLVDQKEGMSAFVEKRNPQFKNK